MDLGTAIRKRTNRYFRTFQRILGLILTPHHFFLTKRAVDVCLTLLAYSTAVDAMHCTRSKHEVPPPYHSHSHFSPALIVADLYGDREPHRAIHHMPKAQPQ